MAAALAIVLAAVGILLVVRYANGADARALAGMETQPVLVAAEPIAQGTAVEEFGKSVTLQDVPKSFLAQGAVSDLADVEGFVLTADVGAGEQIVRGRLATPEQMRARGQVELPEDAADLHQVTVALDKARALGGNIVPGDRVGVFMSFDLEEARGYQLRSDGSVERSVSTGEEETSGGDGGSISTTHLTLHKVLVARVEGGYVAPASGDEEDKGSQAQNSINVTLALDAEKAERLVFAMEFGTVWLSLEPENADEDGTGVVVATVPDKARNIYE